MTTYTAISARGEFRLAEIGVCGDIHLIGDCRSFKTYEEADQVARDASEGKYDYTPGRYVSMR